MLQYLQLAMFSKSNQIKSKKEKMQNKRQQKLKIKPHSIKHPIEQIRIEDSSNEHSSSVQVLNEPPHILKEMKEIQAKQDSKSKSEISPQKFNQFSLQKMKKVTGPIKPTSTTTILNVQQCQEASSNPLEDIRPINYKKAGSKIFHKTCENFLKTRLQKIEEEATKGEKMDQQNINQNALKQISNGDEKPAIQVETIRRIPRYFDDEIEINSDDIEDEDEEDQQEKEKTIKCFRCGGKGHIARMCDKQQVIKCIYCLGPHFNNQCLDKICRNCGEKGHIKQECRARLDKIKCNKCNRLGHIMRNCGRIVMMNYASAKQKEIREKYAKDDLEKLKCFKCNGIKQARGHFNCHEYGKKIPKIYDQTHSLL